MSRSGVEEESSLLLSVPSNDRLPVLDLKASVDATEAPGNSVNHTQNMQYGMGGRQQGFDRPLKPADANPRFSALLHSSTQSHVRTKTRSQDAPHLGQFVQVLYFPSPSPVSSCPKQRNQNLVTSCTSDGQVAPLIRWYNMQGAPSTL